MPQIRIVLCRPSHPGNIGSAARAMKTMGLTDLRLVAPERYPAKEAQWMATMRATCWRAATVPRLWTDSIRIASPPSRCRRAGANGRRRCSTCAAAAARATQIEGEVAFVFGNETAGLTNEEMFACQYLVHIPASTEFSSLNLRQAVQVVATSYTWPSIPAMPFARTERRATVEDLEGLYAHLEAGGAGNEGSWHAGSRLRERWRRLFSRVPAIEREEVNILRGLLRALLGK